MIDLTPIFQAVIALIAALISYKLIPWIKSKTTGQQQSNLYAAAQIAVYAAEQIYGAGQGQEKFQYVLDSLEAAGFKLDGTLAYQAIENAVYMMNNSYVGLPATEAPSPNDDKSETVILAQHPPEEKYEIDEKP